MISIIFSVRIFIKKKSQPPVRCLMYPSTPRLETAFKFWWCSIYTNFEACPALSIKETVSFKISWPLNEILSSRCVLYQISLREYVKKISQSYITGMTFTKRIRPHRPCLANASFFVLKGFVILFYFHF